MRQLFALASAAFLIGAIWLHLLDNEIASEAAGDLAFFTLLAACLVPDLSLWKPQAPR
jgi:hypothetical protein